CAPCPTPQTAPPPAGGVAPRPARGRKQGLGKPPTPAARLTLADLPGRHPDPADTDLAIFFTVAARVFEGVGQDRQQVEFPIVVDRADKTHDSSGSPSRVGKHEAEGNRPKDATEHPSLGSPLRLPDKLLVMGTTCFQGKTFGRSLSRVAGISSQIS